MVILTYTLVLNCDRNLDDIFDGAFVPTPQPLSIVEMEPSDALLAYTGEITLRFSASLKENTLKLGGDLAPQAQVEWAYDHFQLRLTPQEVWEGGADKSLILSCYGEQGGFLSEVLHFTVDSILPDNVSVDPPFKAYINSPQQPIVFSFTEPMDTQLDHLELSGTMKNNIDESGCKWSADEKVLTITPVSNWSESVEDELTTIILDVKDKAGNAMDTLYMVYYFDFTSPNPLLIRPISGGTLSLSRAIEIQFSESIEPASVELTGTLIGTQNVNLIWDKIEEENDFLNLIPETSWEGGADKTLDIIINDYAGNSETIHLNYTIDEVKPQILAVDPSLGALIPTLINGTQLIQVIFSESMDPQSLSFSGTLSSQVGEVQWGNTSIENDTLVISPEDKWSNGPFRKLILSVTDQAGNELITEDTLLYYDVDSLSPYIIETNPETTDLIYYNDTLTFQFNESIDPASLVLDGTMAVQSDGGVFSTTYTTDDTLTISPNPMWDPAEDQTIILSCEDTIGNPMETQPITFTYDITSVRPVISNNNTYHAVSMDMEGTSVYFSYMNTVDQHLYFARSDDRGLTFTVSDSLINPQFLGNFDNKHGSSIQVDGTKIFIVYYNKDDQGLWFSRSQNNGTSWDVQKRIDYMITQDLGGYPSLAINPGINTNLFVSYFRSGVEDTLKYIYSGDNGDNWVGQIIDSNDGTGSYSSIAYYDSYIFISYIDEINGKLKFIKGENDGGDGTWETSQTLDDAWVANTSIYVDAPYVYITYKEGEGYIGLAVNDNLGTAANWNYTIVENTVDTGLYSSVIAQSSSVYVVYYNEGDGNFKFAKSNDYGSSFTGGSSLIRFIDRLGDCGQYPTLKMDSTDLYVGYIGDGSFPVRFAFSLDDGQWW